MRPLFIRLIFCWQLYLVPVLAPAQQGTDFSITDARKPAATAATITDVLPLSDGSQIIRGRFEWVNGRWQTGCARLLANGQPDQAFNARIAPFSEQIVAVVEAPGRKLLVACNDYTSWSSNPLTARSHKGLMRLNWDGSRDPAFAWPPNPPESTFTPDGALLAVQPDGAVLLAGGLAVKLRQVAAKASERSTQQNETIEKGWQTAELRPDARHTVPLLRLRPDGQVDSAFLQTTRQAFASIGGGSVQIQALQVLPNGSLMLGCSLEAADGQPLSLLVRLLRDGSLDDSFKAASGPDYFRALAVQPNGSILVLSNNGTESEALRLRRLLPTGRSDPSFPAPLTVHSRVSALCVQADGRILLLGTLRAASADKAGAGIIRLLPTGKPDPSWQPAPDQPGWATTLQLLLGLVVHHRPVVGVEHGTAETDALPTPADVLTATGALSRPFGLLLQGTTGRVKTEKLADGGWLVYGEFSEIAGMSARNIARLRPDGTLDAAFTANARAWSRDPSQQERVYQVKLQPDGRVLLWGIFSRVGPLAKAGLARLLPSGEPDPSYPPAPSPPMPPKLVKQLLPMEWMTNPLDSLFLYRNCVFHMSAPFSYRTRKQLLRYTVLGGQCEILDYSSRINLFPTADRLTLLAYWKKKLVYKYRFTVKPVPPPIIRCALSSPEQPLAASTIGQRQLVFRAIPDEGFATFLPDDARFRVSRAQATLLRNNAPVEPPLLFVEEGLASNQHNQLPLAQLAATARPGDQLRVEVTGVQRKNARDTMEDIALKAQFVFLIQ